MVSTSSLAALPNCGSPSGKVAISSSLLVPLKSARMEILRPARKSKLSSAPSSLLSSYDISRMFNVKLRILTKVTKDEADPRSIGGLAMAAPKVTSSATGIGAPSTRNVGSRSILAWVPSVVSHPVIKVASATRRHSRYMGIPS